MEYNSNHGLNLPPSPYDLRDLVKFFERNFSSLHFPLMEYHFGEIWAKETIENIVFSLEERDHVTF